jgi:hypothetical protein
MDGRWFYRTLVLLVSSHSRSLEIYNTPLYVKFAFPCLAMLIYILFYYPLRRLLLLLLNLTFRGKVGTRERNRISDGLFCSLGTEGFLLRL